MHTVDGGVVPISLKWIFGIDKKKNDRKKGLPFNVKMQANDIMQHWSRCTPYEFARRVRNITNLNKWKMIEGRTFLMYLSTTLFYILREEGHRFPIFEIWMHLVKSMRLLAGDSVEPVPQVRISQQARHWTCLHSDHLASHAFHVQDDVDLSRTHYAKFFHGMKDRFGEYFCVYKSHASFHIPDDVDRMGMHLDALTAYCFENMMQLFGKVSSRRYSNNYSV